MSDGIVSWIRGNPVKGIALVLVLMATFYKYRHTLGIIPAVGSPIAPT
jgi:hypothetical protein